MGGVVCDENYHLKNQVSFRNLLVVIIQLYSNMKKEKSTPTTQLKLESGFHGGNFFHLIVKCMF